jgi:hypothetical protein
MFLIACVAATLIGLFWWYRSHALIHVSARSGRKYWVRHPANAEILDRLWIKVQKLQRAAHVPYPRIMQFQGDLREVANPRIDGVAYSENKGDHIAVCLRNPDENTLMFVTIHELAHVASATYGHDEAFWNTFRALLQIAIREGVYSYQNFKESHESYCGVTIDSTPFSCQHCKVYRK